LPTVLVQVSRCCSVALSNTCNILVVPRTRLKLGEHAFRVAAPWLLNELPPDIRKSSTLATFKKHLKSFLFCKHYGLVLEQ